MPLVRALQLVIDRAEIRTPEVRLTQAAYDRRLA
jgi:hypothetical protein